MASLRLPVNTQKPSHANGKRGSHPLSSGLRRTCDPVHCAGHSAFSGDYWVLFREEEPRTGVLESQLPTPGITPPAGASGGV